jgi:hypothetical protein
MIGDGQMNQAEQSLRMAKINITQAKIFRHRKHRKDNEWIAFLQECAAKYRREWFELIRKKRDPDTEKGQLNLFA